jgi:hypothetical protein
MADHAIDLDQEYEILHPTEFYGQRVRESLGTVFARNAREAITAARQEFGRGLGKLSARLVS